MQTQFSGSAHQAQAILGAWQSGDTNRLQVELDGVENIHAADSGEEERLELLAEIARELRAPSASVSDPVYNSLLQHLAYPARKASRALATRASGCARAAAATALQ